MPSQKIGTVRVDRDKAIQAQKDMRRVNRELTKENERLKSLLARYENNIDSRSPVAAAPGLIPKQPGEFHSYQNWVNKAQSWLKSPSHKPPICLDARNRRCFIGSDFMRARDENAFPVRYFWDFEESAAAPSADAKEDDRG